MSDVTNIKTITNQLLYAVTVRNGENTQQTFTVNASSGWNGDMWIPWVNSPSEMYKSIRLDWPRGSGQAGTTSFYILQYGDYIYYSWENDFNKKNIIGGNNGIRGEKALIIASSSDVHLA